jgi:hypothetical protein
MRALAMAAVLCCAAACGTDPAVAPPTDLTPSAAAASVQVAGPCNENNLPSGWVERVYHCGDVVHVTSSIPDLSAKIPAAIAIWNSEVFAHDGLPSFSATTGSLSIPISWGETYNIVGATTIWYCGDNPSGGSIKINRAGAKTDCGKTSSGSGTAYTNAVAEGGLPSLIAHELGHSIGFKHLSSIIVATGKPTVPAADNCVSALPANGSLNGSVCQAEIELLHLNYGLRNTEISPSKRIATGLTVSGSTLVNPGNSGTLTVGGIQFARGAPGFPAPDPTTLTYAWSSNNTAIARVSPGSGASNAIQAVAAGTATINVGLNSTVYDQAVPLLGSAIPFTVNSPPPAPTGLSASAITGTAATISWVNGATGALTTTTLEYRKHGVTAWTTASSTIASGVTSFGLTGLAGLTTYDVRVWHVRNQLQGAVTTAASLFTTLDPNAIPAITNFHVTSCDQRPSGAKMFNYYQLAWTSATAPAGYTFEIGVNTTSSSAGASVIVTYPSSARTGEVGGYLVSPTLMNRWFWIRYVGNGNTGGWTALADNPLATNGCLR